MSVLQVTAVNDVIGLTSSRNSFFCRNLGGFQDTKGFYFLLKDIDDGFLDSCRLRDCRIPVGVICHSLWQEQASWAQSLSRFLLLDTATLSGEGWHRGLQPWASSALLCCQSAPEANAFMRTKGLGFLSINIVYPPFPRVLHPQANMNWKYNILRMLNSWMWEPTFCICEFCKVNFGTSASADFGIRGESWNYFPGDTEGWP